jgi:long-chain fatty acid transport protein
MYRVRWETRRETRWEIGATHKSALMAAAATAAFLATMGPASAGGFAIREQSAQFQGMSFAGNAAGGSLSSMFWNSAATASRDGMNTESSSSVILGESKVTVTNNPYSGFPTESGDIAPPALVGASYGSYQLTKNIYVGMAVNAPFGLETDPANITYQGAVIARKTELTTYNFNPTVAVRIAPGLTVGAGVQIQTADGNFRFASGHPAAGTTKVEGNGWGFGGTAGITYEVSPTTTLGVGYRSQVDQDINGNISGAVNTATKVTLKLPDIVTASIVHDISPMMRVAGSFEWTNWSRFKELSVSPIGLSVPLNWSDGYFVSGGVEYDIYPTLTGRAGIAYEWSPVDSPEKRTTGFPDNNRVWLSGGFSWDFTKSTTIDFAYTHIFVEDGAFVREDPLTSTAVAGGVESKVDIVSFGVKTHW